MNRTDAPAKQGKPFGINGQREPLLPTTPAGDNTASYELGFPPITMILKSAGGLPPKGQDMNQILYELSSLCRWMSTGALNAFDQEFSVSIGGYPKASVVIGDDGVTPFISTMDNNTNNPNSISTGWLSLSKIISIAGLDGGENKLPYFTGLNTASQTDLTQVGRDIISKNTIADIIQYLMLGTAAQRNVGTGENQIPDMSAFSFGSRWISLPSGHIIQFDVLTAGAGDPSGWPVTNYPIPFPNSLLLPPIAIHTGNGAVDTSVNFIVDTEASLTHFRAGTSGLTNQNGAYIAIGI